MITKEIGELVLKALGPGGQVETMQKQVNRLMESKGDTSDALKKAAALLGGMGGPSPQMLSGWNGAGRDGATLFNPMGKKVKSVGHGVDPESGRQLTKAESGGSFGDWLTWVAAATCPTANKWLNPNLPAYQGCGNREAVEKAMKGFDKFPVSKAANAEGSGATGGFLVPPQYNMKILQHVAERAFLKAMCTTVPMQGREYHFPYLNQQSTTASSASNFPSSNWFGGVYNSWTPEAQTYQQTNPGWKMGELVARDLVSITVSSNQLLQDSAVPLESMITTLLADSLAWQLDYAFLRGNGVNQPLGILNAPGTIASSRAASHALLTSLSDMVSRAMNIGSEWDNYIWVIHQTVLPYLIRLTNSATNSPFLVWLNPAPGSGDGPMSSKWPGTIFGRPFYITEKLPEDATQGDVCLLDCSKYLCGDRMSISIEASQFPYFTSNQMVWRTIWRGDGQPWFDAATTLASGTTTVSPHVILAT